MSKSLRELKAKQQEEWRAHIAELYEKGLISRKTYIKYSEAKDAYEYVLSTGVKAIPALQFVADKYDLPPDWVDKVKSSPMHRDMLKRLLEDTREHSSSTLMLEQGVTTTNSKRALKEARTVSSTLNTLSEQVNLARRLSNLENSVDILTQRVDNLEQAVLSVAKETVNNHNRISKLELKEEAKTMYEKGLTQAEIARKLGKSQKTVSNWLKLD